MSKKIFAGVLATMFAFSLVAVPAKAATVEELLALIQQLQSQLAAMQGGGSGTTSGYQFTRNLTLGSTGADVMELQKFLVAKGHMTLANYTNYFGPVTRAGVIAFQKANNITPAVGYFGPLTRAAVNSMGGGVGGGTLPTSAFLKAELAGPSSGSVPSGSIYNPILKVKLSAGNQAVTVSGIKVMRGGFVSNTNITGVSAWDEMGNRYGNILSSLTSDGEASFSFGNSPITIAAGASKTITIAANLATGSYGGTISFSLMNASSVTATGGTVMGVFPISGPALTIVDGSTSLGNVLMNDVATIGVASATAVLASYEGNIEVGYTDREVYKFNLSQSNSKEAVKLERIRLYVGGTIQDDKDLKNFKLYSQEGNVIATADRAYDRYVTFTLTTPYMIDKGLSKDFTVKADITDGSGRYFYLTLQDDYDVVVRGMTTGAGVLALDSTSGSLTSSDVQNDSNGWHKIKQGVATVSKASSSPSGNIAPGSQNIVLGEFDVKAGGEALEIRKVGVQVKFAVATGTGTLSIKNKATGETYLSIAADTTGIMTTGAVSAATLLTYQQNLSSYINLAAGETKTLQVIGTIPQTATSSANYTAYMGQFYSKRLSTNDYTTLAATAVAGNTLTVKDVTANVTKNASFGNTNRSSGATNVKIGSFNLQAVGDDIRFNTISLSITTSSNFQNVKLMDGSTQVGNTLGTPASTGNSFSLSNYVVSRDTTKTIDVYADVLSTATTTSVVSVEASGVTGVGVSSSKSLSSTPGTAVDLQTITVSTPSLTISKDGSAPTAKIVIADQNAVELHKIKFEAQNEALTLKKITLQLVSASSTQWLATSTVANFGTVSLYDGSTLLGTGTFNSTDATVQISGLNLSLPQDTEKVLTVKANISSSGTLLPRSVVGMQLYSTGTDYLEVYSSQGLISSGITSSSNALSNYMLYHDTAPAIANAMSSTTKTPSTNQEISKFTVSNPSTSRSMKVDQIVIIASASGLQTTGAVTTFRLYDDGGVLIATSSAADTLSSSTTPLTLTFASSSVGGTWGTQSIAAGGSRTFTLKADTTSIRNGVTSGGNVYLSTKIDGSKGYLSTDVTGPEFYWNTGGLTYQYTQAISTTVYGTNVATDSYPVDGATITY